MNEHDPFYIGWEESSAPVLGKRLRALAAIVLAGALLTGLIFAAVQSHIEPSTFEWGVVRSFSGQLLLEPIPRVVIFESNNPVAYYLVAPFKHGIEKDELAGMHGMQIELKGTLIQRGDAHMIEVIGGSVRLIDQQNSTSRDALKDSPMRSLGVVTLRGEIVDSKCHWGVMNPGDGIPHRACAIRCISGGIPPVLRTRGEDGKTDYFFLSTADGSRVSDAVVPFVAEPIEISGEQFQQGSLKLLKGDFKSIRRL